MNAPDLDWSSLERLRALFLAGTAGEQDYWRSDADVVSYDHTFGQRIAWKWDHVLEELVSRGWAPPRGVVLDWGCGSGVAARQFLRHFGTGGVEKVVVWDRSARAMRYALRTLQADFPGLAVAGAAADPVSGGGASGPERAPAVLLLSHVLTELTEAMRIRLVEWASAATALLWVEPGTHEASRRLIAVRENLRDRLHPVAPCTQGGPCDLCRPENERHWCHQFATPPPEIFADGRWVRFGRLAGVDLRSLPLSQLVLDARGGPVLPGDAARVLGRPRVYKAHALVLGCDASGVHEREVGRRHLPDVFRRLRKGALGDLVRWVYEGSQVAALQPLLARDEPGEPTDAATSGGGPSAR